MSQRDGRILGLDYGRKRIGVALSDPGRLIAQGLPTITSSHPLSAVRKLAEIVAENKVTKIVIGLPLTLKGTRGQTVIEIEEFIELMRTRIQVPIVTWDERFTTTIAEQTLLSAGKSPSKNRDKVDQIAAVLILQSYLDFSKS